MKIWELINELSKYPAGYDVTITGESLEDARRIKAVEEAEGLSVVNLEIGQVDE